MAVIYNTAQNSSDNLLSPIQSSQLRRCVSEARNIVFQSSGMNQYNTGYINSLGRVGRQTERQTLGTDRDIFTTYHQALSESPNDKVCRKTLTLYTALFYDSYLFYMV